MNQMSSFHHTEITHFLWIATLTDLISFLPSLHQKMSYNGIGLSTVRGSGTSGHIQRNLSTIRPRHVHKSMTQDFKALDSSKRKANPEIVAHERKRQVELKCIELQDELEEAGVDEEEIEERVSQLRSKLMVEYERSQVQELKKYARAHLQIN